LATDAISCNLYILVFSDAIRHYYRHYFAKKHHLCFCVHVLESRNVQSRTRNHSESDTYKYIYCTQSISNYDEVYSQSNADIYRKKQNTILLNDRQRNRHASKQDK